MLSSFFVMFCFVFNAILKGLDRKPDSPRSCFDVRAYSGGNIINVNFCSVHTMAASQLAKKEGIK